MFLSWLGLMLKGCISVHPFLFNAKFFLRKPLILLDLFNIIKNNLKKSLLKLFTIKKVVYICKVNTAQNNLKTRIMKDFLKFALAVYLLGLIIGIIESI